MNKRLLNSLIALGLLVTPICNAAEVAGNWNSSIKVQPAREKPADSLVINSEVDFDITDEINDNLDWKLKINLSTEKYTNQKDDWHDSYDLDNKFKFSTSEAYLNYSTDHQVKLDVCLGKQYVKLGAGDGITTFTLLEPIYAKNMEDLTNSASVWGGKLVWYPGDFTVTAFYQPLITPAKLEGEVSEAAQAIKLATLLEATKGLPIDPTTIVTKIETIDYKEDPLAGAALKVSHQIAGYDLSAIWESGYSPIALPAEFLMNENKLICKYMPTQKIGTTVTGTLGDFGTWGELTYTIPKKDFYDSNITALLENVENEQYKLSDKPYLTGLIGADYFLPKGTYINLQVLHGLPHEISANMLSTAVIADISKTFKADKIKIELTGIGDFTNKGYVISPKIEYQTTPNSQAWIKGTILGGDEGTLYDALSDKGQIACGVKVVF